MRKRNRKANFATHTSSHSDTAREIPSSYHCIIKPARLATNRNADTDRHRNIQEVRLQMKTDCVCPKPAEHSKVPRELTQLQNLGLYLSFDYKEYVFWGATSCSLVYNVSEEPASNFL
jgi:hypothetical protein